MSVEALAIIALICAAIPAVLHALNLLVYRALPLDIRSGQGTVAGVSDGEGILDPVAPAVSVLIPVRDEAGNISRTLKSILSTRGCEFEVILMDDHSSDQTAAIVEEFVQRDPRVRLATAPPLPAGWCGKQHACHLLAKLARNPLLVFIDADVRLAPDALLRMTAFMARSNVALASGVPRQELGTFAERLLLPLIHFVLLGFLPMHAMRRSLSPSMSAGCGQLFVARRDAYHRSGGHARLRDSLHDGLKLPRVFREAGFATGLFDATDLATCRMYPTNAQTWSGLGKNATEGLAAPGTIGPMTALLLGGQVMPFVLLACAPMLSEVAVWIAMLAAALAIAPRLAGVWKFRQPLGSALLHPIGVLGLLVIQWHALGRQLLGKPSEWKGRSYGVTSVPAPSKVT